MVFSLWVVYRFCLCSWVMLYVLHFYILLPWPVVGFGDLCVVWWFVLLLCIFNTLFFISSCNYYNFQYIWICSKKSRLEDILEMTEKEDRKLSRNSPENKVGTPRQYVGLVLWASGTNIPFSASGRPKYNDLQCDCFELNVFLLGMWG